MRKSQSLFRMKMYNLIVTIRITVGSHFVMTYSGSVDILRLEQQRWAARGGKG